jgi:hypothetical protein
MSLSSKAQEFTSIIIKDNTNLQTSYYDIIKANNNTIYLCGKNGVLAKIENDSVVLVQKLEQHLYKFLQISDSVLLITANKGYLYYYNIYTNLLVNTTIKKLSKSCIYASCKTNDTTIYICGGTSNMALAKKDLPKGFIYQSVDKGISWKKIYSKKIRMIWDVHYNYTTKHIEAIAYAPWGSKIISFNKNKHSIYKNKNLLHQFTKNNSGMYNGGSFKKNTGFLSSLNNEPINNSDGFCWSSFYTNDYLLSLHSVGNVYLHRNNQLTKIETNTKNNLYEICQYNTNEYFIAGSNNTVLKVTVSK